MEQKVHFDIISYGKGVALIISGIGVLFIAQRPAGAITTAVKAQVTKKVLNVVNALSGVS